MNLSLLRDCREKRSIIERVHTRTHITIVDCKHAEELKAHPKWRVLNEK